jgi:hypothetical protein
VLSWALFAVVAAVVIVGQALLIRSAWRFQNPSPDLPPGVPRSDPRGDLAWTLVTALGTALVLVVVYRSLL